MESIRFNMASSRHFITSEDFSAEDLNIFAESVETIARIERERQERRKARRTTQRTSSRKTVEVEVHSQPWSANASIDYRALEAEDLRRHSRPVCAAQLRCKLFESTSDISPIQSSDENYFSGASSAESPSRGSKESLDIDGVSSLPSTDSGTESESGFGGIRPRSNAMNRSTRARIIGLVMKKEQSREDSIKDRRERVLNGLLREKEKYEMMLQAVQKKAGSELKSISKALNCLTL